MVSIMKSLQELQQENKKLEGQIQSLSTQKGELELARAQLSVPYTPVLSTPQIYHCATQVPSAPPTPPYVRPVLSFSGGEVRGPDGQIGMVVSRYADINLPRAPPKCQPPGAQTRMSQNIPMEVTQGASARAVDPTPPSQMVDLMELQPLDAQEEDGTEDNHSVNSSIRHEVPQRRNSLTPGTANMVSPAEELRNVQYTPLPDPGRKQQHASNKEAGPKGGQWKGQVHGKMCENKTALAEILRIVADVQKRVFKENRDEMEEEDELSEEEEPGRSEDIAEAPKSEWAVKNLRSRDILTSSNQQKPRGAKRGTTKQSGRPK